MGTGTDGWVGIALLDSDGRRLGTIEDMYRHPQSGRPQWVVVRLGRFASRRTLVPLAAVRRAAGGVVTPYAKSMIAAAPKVDPDALRDADAVALCRYYGLPHDDGGGEDAPSPPTPRDRVIDYLAKSEERRDA